MNIKDKQGFALALETKIFKLQRLAMERSPANASNVVFGNCPVYSSKQSTSTTHVEGNVVRRCNLLENY